MSHLHQKFFFLLVLLLPVQLGRHFWPEWSMVFGIRVDYLSPTIYLTDILVFLILLTWGIQNLKSQIANIKSTSKISKLLGFLFFLALVFLFNILFSKNQPVAIYKLVKILEFSLLGLYVAKNRSPFSLLLNPLSIAVIYSSLIAIAQFFKQASLGGLFWWLGERTFNTGTAGIAKAVVDGQLLMRPYATFPHPNALAGFLLISLILTLPFFLKRSRLFVTCYLLLVTVALFLSFSRAAWFVGLLVIGFLLLKKIIRFKRFLILNSSFLVLIFGAVFLIKSDILGEEAFWQRLDLTRSAFLMIQTSPLFGVGLNNFLVRLPEFWHLSGPTYLLQPVHNIYLLIAAETGLIGLAIFLWFIFLTFRRLFLITALTAALLLGLFDHYWLTLQQTQLLFAIILGLSWGEKEAKIRR